MVFFKGCPLSCLWCHNPESKQTGPEICWDEDSCIGCGDCISACPKSAISPANRFFIDREICDLCFDCVAACPSATALLEVGQSLEISEIVARVLRYKPFFDTSGGGVTLSGGEPTLAMEFTSELMRKLKAEGIHTLLETAGVFNFEQFCRLILPFTDMIYFDVKLIDPEEHKRYCGADNAGILDNFRRLHQRAGSDFELLPRTPLIPGITDSDHNIDGLAAFYRQLGVTRTQLLPGNPAWIPKLKKIGKVSPFESTCAVTRLYDPAELERVRLRFSRLGIEASSG